MNWASRLKKLYRYAIVRAGRDQRHRRFALNHIFSTHLTANTLCLTSFDDHEIFTDPRDDKIAFTILSGQAWQRRQFDRALSAASAAGRITPDSVFVDVGANIGAITLYALLSGYFRHVLALEPDPHNRGILERNIKHNGFAEHVTVIPAAASDRTATQTFYRDARNFGAHSLEAGFSRGQGEAREIPVAPLDHLVRDAGYSPGDIGLLKIDVEGHEHAVLRGMPEILACGPPLMLEITYREAIGNQDADWHVELNDAIYYQDPHATLTYLPARYTACLPLDAEAATSTAPAMFRPHKSQHDLLIFEE